VIETKKSFCRFCHVFCGVEVDIDGDRVVAVRGDRDNAVTRGYTCEKGRAEVERIHHPDRLLSSQKRVEGRLEDIASVEALDEIGARLRAIIDEHGPEAVAVYVGNGGHRTSAGGPWFLTKWLEAIGSPRLYTSFTIDSPSLFFAMHRLFGSPVPVNLFDIDRADVALFVGTNPVASHMMTMPQSSPARRLADAQKRGMKLLVIDPRRSDVARKADVHLQVKPGEDAALLAGIIKVILDEGLQDDDYIETCVSGVDALHQAVAAFDLDYVAARTWVPAEMIREAARIFAMAPRGGAQSGTGLHMARHQNLTTQLVMTLNALTGRYDREGGLARNRGALGPDIPEGLQGRPTPHFVGPTARVRGIRGSFSLIGFCNEMPTSTLTDEILTPGKGQIRALLVSGGNPALLFPDAHSTAEALDSLDLLVCCDLFESATARHADYVMAVKHPFERADITRLADGSFPFPFAQYAPPIVDAPGDLIEEWQVFYGLAARLGVELPIPGISMEQTPTTDEMIDALHRSARVPIDEIRAYESGHVFGDAELCFGGMIPNMIGHPDGKMAAGHPELLDELAAVRAEPDMEGGGFSEGEVFGFRMITYRLRETYCSAGQNLPSLNAKRPFNPMLIHPESLRQVGAESGDVVIVDSGFGQIEAVAEATDDVPPGVIALAAGWGDPADPRGPREKGSNVQELIPDDARYDPVTGLAQQSAVPVDVRCI
jgi:anaerobic selenocysteine-containing dehydrogenase